MSAGLKLLLAVAVLLLAATADCKIIKKVRVLPHKKLVTKAKEIGHQARVERFSGSRTLKSANSYLDDQNGAGREYNVAVQRQTQQNVDKFLLRPRNVQGSDNSGGELRQNCSGPVSACVSKSQCQNGVMIRRRRQAGAQKQYCDSATEICCRIETSPLSRRNLQNPSEGVTETQGVFNQSGSSQNSQHIRFTSRGKTRFSKTQFGSQSISTTEQPRSLTTVPTPYNLELEVENINEEIIESISHSNLGRNNSDASLFKIKKILRRGVVSGSITCGMGMKCTTTEYCSVEGLISSTAVPKDRDAYRVKLSDCSDAATGVSGKCCRDPSYSGPADEGKWDPALFGLDKSKWIHGKFGGNDGKWIPGKFGEDDGKWIPGKFGSDDGKWMTGVFVDNSGKWKAGLFGGDDGKWDPKKYGDGKYVPAAYKGDSGKWVPGVFEGNDGKYLPDDRGTYKTPRTPLYYTVPYTYTKPASTYTIPAITSPTTQASRKPQLSPRF